MKILIVTDVYYPKIDGVVVSILNLTKTLTKKKHTFCIIAPEYDKKVRKIRNKKIREHRLKGVSFPTYKEFKIAIPNYRKVNKIITNFEPDVIHIQTPGTLGLLGMVIAKRKKIPVVNTYHTSIPDILVYASPIKMLKLDKLLENSNLYVPKKIPKLSVPKKFKEKIQEIIPKLKVNSSEFTRNAVWNLTNRFYDKSDMIITPTSKIKDELLKYGSKSEVKVVSNGIELDIFTKKRRYSSCKKFLYVGRVGFEKRVDVIIDAFKIVNKKYPETRLTVVGDGPAIESLKENNQNVKFTGYIKRKDLPLIYRKHDVFLTASEMETQGLVLIEAMACGLPVIGVDALAVPEVIKDGYNGFLCRPKDSEQIAKRMVQLIKNPDLAKEYGKNARKEAEKHDLNKTAEVMEGVYKDCLSK